MVERMIAMRQRISRAGLLGAFVAFASSASGQVAIPAPDKSRSSVSVGGEVRQEYEWFDNEEWGAGVPDKGGYWLQRYMFHGDARLSRRVRLYGELKSGLEVGRAGLVVPTRIASICTRHSSIFRSGRSPYARAVRSWCLDRNG